MNLKKALLYTSLACILTSCDDIKRVTTTNSNNEKISYIHSNDKDMNNAISKAQSTFENFKKVFIESQDNSKFNSFAIKIGFDSPRFGKEYMWINELKLEGGTFKGRLNNHPEDSGVAYAYGDTITIEHKDVGDWLYTELLENDVEITHGGFTIRVLREKMSLEERNAFDESIGLNFED